MTQNPNLNKNRGYATLTSVIVVGAIGLAIAVSMLALSINSHRASHTVEKSTQAKALANGCAEYTINQLKISTDYSGNETLNFTTGSCEILPVQGSGGSNRTIQTTGNVDDVVRKIQVVVLQVNPTTEISSWKEVGDF
ncbi:MAG: hypothetical protein U9Q67_04830 [Patescibacteria group bacterium]|nr:hypothetical protein [Patescibacteria group bacterium]